MSRIDIREIHPINAEEILQLQLEEEPSYIGPGVLPYGSKMLFGGNSKIGKSMLCIELARGLITGTAPFDCPKLIVPEPVNVLYIEAEIGVWGIQKRLQRALNNVPSEAQRRLHLMARLRTIELENPAHADEVARLVNEAKASVLIIDPISKVHHYNENDNNELQRLFERLDHIQDKADKDLAIILSHHFSKPPREKRDNVEFDDLSFNNFRGGGKLAADPDTLVTVKIDEKAVVPPNGWAIRTRWVTRQGIPALEDNAKFEIYRGENGRVLYVPDERSIIPKVRSRKPTTSLDTVGVEESLQPPR